MCDGVCNKSATSAALDVVGLLAAAIPALTGQVPI